MSTLSALLRAIPDWEDDALCQQVDPELFFPATGEHGTAAKAKFICARCPVRQQCLRHALDTHEPHGIWGGLTEKERRTYATQQVAA